MTQNPSTPSITLFQFQLCPFCHKVRAALELKGVDYTRIEVAPGSKKELPDLPPDAPRKVPVMQVDDEIIWDSTSILLAIDRLVPQGMPLNTDDDHGGQEVREFDDWVDHQLMPALPTVIYDTWANSVRAAKITARESNFNAWDNFKVRVGGSLIMKLVVKRILKREGRTDGHSWLQECLDEAEKQLGDKQFVMGDHPTIADAGLHGAFSCVEEFPIFEEIMRRPRLKTWFDRIQSIRIAQC